MNHVFRLIWSRNLGMLVPVPEGLKAPGRGQRALRRRIRRLARKGVLGTAAAGGLVLAPIGALALPTGGQVAAGAATVAQTGGAMTVTQTSDKAVLNWQGFGIDPGETVTFLQPSTSSIALNRVLGHDPSAIYGRLDATGQVFLVNPNGITFAPGAQVNAAGIVASTMGIEDADFLAGKYSFSGEGGTVANAGEVTAGEGGYVAFIGQSVSNDGTISAPGGTVALGAGAAVDMTLAGNTLLSFRVSAAALDAAVANGGAIRADGGAVILSAAAKNAVLQTVVNTSGVISARGVRKGPGGTIQLLGGGGGVAVSGTVDASAAQGRGGSVVATAPRVTIRPQARISATGGAGGGTIAIGGGWRGGGGIAQARQVTVENGAVIDASGTGTGSGGQISVWSDVFDTASVTLSYGTLRARGGARGGDGGRIETSGHRLDVTGSTVDAAAVAGAGGQWLLDPYDVVIAASGASGTSFSDTFTPSAPSVILNTDIETALNAGTTVTIETGSGGNQNGDITVAAPITWDPASGNVNALIFSATGSVIVDAPLTVASSGGGMGRITVQYGQGSTNGAGTSFVVNAPITLPANAIFGTQKGSAGTAVQATVLTTATALQDVATGDLAGSYVLGNNIDLSGIANFTPIGSTSTNFTGIFDGLGHTVSNLTITGSSSFVGLFGVTSNATLRNVGLVGGSVSGNGFVGALAGDANTSAITNVYATVGVSGQVLVGGLVGASASTAISGAYATGGVSGSSNVGGLVGKAFHGSISNAHATGDVSGSPKYAGGLVGATSNATINDAYATGGVTGGSNAGGLVGQAKSGSISNAHATGGVTGHLSVGGLVGYANSSTISNAYATGAVTGNISVGGLVGTTYSSKISNAYAAGVVSGSLRVGGLVGSNWIRSTVSSAYATGAVSGTSNVGGLVGLNYLYSTISNAYATGAVSGNTNVGGLVGFNTSNGTISNGFWDTTTQTNASLPGVGSSANGASTNNVAGLTTAGLATALPTGFDGAVWSNSDGQTTPWLLANRSFGTVSGNVILGSDSSAAPARYDVIATPDQLQNITTTGLAGAYVLGNDIDLSSIANFTPIRNGSTAFTGTFDGLGHTISNLTITGSNNNVGLFGYANGATLRNVGLVGGSVSGGSNVGGLAGYAYSSSISNAYATGNVSGGNEVGGLVGHANSSTISNAYATGSVSGGTNVGGLAGYSSGGTISNSYATGDVSATGGGAGGLVGWAFYDNTISNAYATGSVSGVSYVGGLAGFAYSSSISNAYATGKVSGGTNVGGLVGWVDYGNLIGNAYASGSVSGSVNIGGLVGSGYASTIRNVYATGIVSGGTNVGVLVGSNSSGAISNGYWDTTTQTNASLPGVGISRNGASTNSVAGLTTAGLATALPTGFDASKWSNSDGQTTPWLLANRSFGTVSGSVLLSSDTSATPVQWQVIASADQLQNINATGLGGDYVLGQSVDLSSIANFMPIGNASTQFTGQFDGLGYTLSDLTIDRSTLNEVGLFGFASGATIRNLGVLGGSVTGNNHVGGLVGQSANTAISNAFATVTIAGLNGVGGLVGWNVSNAKISDAYATGTVTGRSAQVGGLVGLNDSSGISNAYATGAVSGPINVGGLVGLNAYSATISNAYATGAVSGSTIVGGLVGRNTSSAKVSNGYWDTATVPTLAGVGVNSNGASTTNVAGLSTAELATALPTGFDGAVWSNSDGQTTPWLLANRSFDTVSGAVLLGSDTSATPAPWQVIATPDQLQNINATGLGRAYVLGTDIDLSPIANFTPIGSTSTNFTGIFDGLGHTVSNLTITGSNNNVGLFGFANGATLRNVGLVGGSVSGGDYVGGLVGVASSVSISNAYTTGSVSGTKDVGGLVGQAKSGSISNAYATGGVTGSSNVGGLVGFNYSSSTISNAYATGTVTGDLGVGGLVGVNTSNAKISNAYATGDVSGWAFTGGLAGFNSNGTISNTYATGTVIGTSYVGGLAGFNSNGTISNAYWDTTTQTNASLPGVGLSTNGASTNNIAGLTTAELATALPTGFYASVWTNSDGQVTPWLLANRSFGTVSGSVLLGSDTSATPAQWQVIATPDQMQNISSTGLGGDYVLGQSLDLASIANFTPIGDNVTTFTGKFDGLGYTLSNLTIKRPSSNFVGLFGHTYGATIRNLGLVGGSVTGQSFVGGLVGSNYNSKLSNAYSTGDVKATSIAGGLVGRSAVSSTISNTYATGTVTGTGANIGGLVGANVSSAEISMSYVSGTVSGTSNIGGFVGVNSNSTISNAYAVGSVTGTANIGGLVGVGNGGTISNAYATSKVSAAESSPGVIGAVQNAGGFVGKVTGGTVANVYAAGAVAGGAGSSNVGGLVGRQSGGSVSNVYATGAVSGGAGSTGLGGLVGAATGGALSNGYWVISTTGQGTSGAGSAKTLADLSGALPTGFDASLWSNSDNYSTPWLLANRSFDTTSGQVLLGSDTGATPTPFQVIATPTQLQTMGSFGQNFVLGQDVDLGGIANFTPLGGFGGTFEGAGHTISNLTIDQPTMDHVGLFGGLSDYAVVRNLTLANVDVSGASDSGALHYVGALAGSTQGPSIYGSPGTVVSNVTVSGTVSGGLTTFSLGAGAVQLYNDTLYQGVGGVVGWANGGTFTNITSAANVSGVYNIGGIIGRTFQAQLSDSSGSGTITGASGGSSNVGGIIGRASNHGVSYDTLSNVWSTGTVSGTVSVGGLVGYNRNHSTIASSYSTATVTGIDLPGLTLSNIVANGSAYIGGLVGRTTNSRITDSYATGNVTGSRSVGGLAGLNSGGVESTNTISTRAARGTIVGSYATGNVTGITDVGGLVGNDFPGNDSVYSTVTSNSYATGTVTGGASTGGLIGSTDKYSTVTGSYATGSVTGGTYFGTYYGIRLGGLVGKNRGILSDVHATGAVTGTNAVGGLVGQTAGNTTNSASIADAYATGAVSGTVGVGGLVGRIGSTNASTNTPYATVAGSYASGAVTGTASVGGLVGSNKGGGINQSYASGAVTGTSNTGGLLGLNKTNGMVTNVYATGSVAATSGQISRNLGGLVGRNDTNAAVSNAYATGPVTPGAAGSSNSGALAGLNSGTIGNGYWDTTTAGATGLGANAGTVTGGGALTTDALASSLPSGFDSSIWSTSDGRVTPWLLANRIFDTVSGDVIMGTDTSATPTAYHVIYNPAQLQNINITGLGDSYVLGSDIDLGSIANFTPIGLDTITGTDSRYDGTPFTGTFDGLGHTISNLTITGANDYVGLFGKTSNATLRNVGVVGGSVSGQFAVGGLVGYAAGSNNTISNAFATVDVSGGERTGSTNYVGYIGGLVGINHGTISGAYATGSVIAGNASRYLGGLAGENWQTGKISNAYATGGVTAGDQASYVGGLVGANDVGARISNAYAAGSVTTGKSGDHIGGLAGWNYNGSKISNAYATGGVSVGSNSGPVGGLVGANYGTNTTIANVYASGPVTFDLVAFPYGALVGSNAAGATVTNGYWSTNTTGVASDGPGVTGSKGLSTAQMMQQASFTGFDFTSPTWVIYEGHTAPLLGVFMTPATVVSTTQHVTYDGQAHTGTVQVKPSGVAPGGALFGQSGTVNGADAGFGAPVDAGTYTVTIWSDQQGYLLDTTSATLTIDKRVLTGSIATGSSTYGDVLAPGAVSFSNLVSGDDVSASVKVDTTSNLSGSSNLKAGSYTGIESVSALTGADAGNYSIGTISGDYEVAKLALSGTIATGSSTYGETLAPGAVSFTNLVSGDTVDGTVDVDTTSNQSGSSNLKAGSYTGIESVSALTGADAGNYSIGTISGDYEVAKLALTGTIATGSSTYGETLAPGAVSFANLVSGDTVDGTVDVDTTGNLSGSSNLKAGSYTGIE
ncbi:MAG: filamentous hemagglutinin N-terminal domain-containing protein, partial [Limimaricola sp.]|uniref:GLUG motif-containing protein n=1 Tax=Limimaricola sp. TaxID=2211665 RepID=UPI001D63AFC2